MVVQATTIPLDVSWHMPNSTRSAVAEYLSGPRLPGARRFDLDEAAELDIEKNPLHLSHMLPSAERFREACGESRRIESGRPPGFSVGLRKADDRKTGLGREIGVDAGDACGGV